MAQYVNTYLEGHVRKINSLSGSEDVKVFALNKDDSYGTGLSTAVEVSLEINGNQATKDIANYLRRTYGNPDDEASSPLRYDAAVDELVAWRPHIVLLIGTDETATQLLPKIEAKQLVPAPIYVLSEGGFVNQLWEDDVKNNDELRLRVTGTMPAPNSNDPTFTSFTLAYKAQPFDESVTVFGTAGVYDAIHLLAYSAAMAGNGEITGKVLADGLEKMAPPGLKVFPGNNEINTAFRGIAEGKDIDYDGASGPLDFNVNTGEAPSNIQIVCLPKTASGAAGEPIQSGFYLDSTTCGSSSDATKCAFKAPMSGEPDSMCN